MHLKPECYKHIKVPEQFIPASVEQGYQALCCAEVIVRQEDGKGGVSHGVGQQTGQRNQHCLVKGDGPILQVQRDVSEVPSLL